MPLKMGIGGLRRRRSLQKGQGEIRRACPLCVIGHVPQQPKLAPFTSLRCATLRISFSASTVNGFDAYPLPTSAIQIHTCQSARSMNVHFLTLGSVLLITKQT